MKKLLHASHYTAFVACALILLVLWLHPTTSSLLFPFKRAQMLSNFIAKINKTAYLNAREFWQFREFYYPGALTVQKSGIQDSTSPTLPLALEPYLFTIFRSSKITSYEYLVTKNALNLVVPNNTEWKTFTKGSVAYRNSEYSVDLVFIKPISEMVQANGFLDYKDKDKKLLEGKYWLVVTRIRK